jgi:hypothetical protein
MYYYSIPMEGHHFVTVISERIHFSSRFFLNCAETMKLHIFHDSLVNRACIHVDQCSTVFFYRCSAAYLSLCALNGCQAKQHLLAFISLCTKRGGYGLITIIPETEKRRTLDESILYTSSDTNISSGSNSTIWGSISSSSTALYAVLCTFKYVF